MDNDNGDESKGYQVEFKEGERLPNRTNNQINNNIKLITECIGVLDEIKNRLSEDLSILGIEKIGEVEDRLILLRRKLIDLDISVITRHILSKISNDILEAKHELLSVNLNNLDNTMSKIVSKLNEFFIGGLDLSSINRNSTDFRKAIESFEDKVRSLENRTKMQQTRIDNVIDQFRNDSQKELINLTKIISEHEKNLSHDRDQFYEMSLREYNDYNQNLEALKQQAQSVVNV